MSTLESKSSSSVSAPRSLSLQFNQLIPATRAEVFAAWTNPELLRVWFAPGNMSVPNFARDLRNGGSYRIEMQGTLAVHNGEESLRHEDPVVVAQGVYTRLIPDRQIAYTWAGSWNPSEESHVTVRLLEEAAGTRLTLDHEDFQSEASLQVHRSGWQSSLAKLREIFPRNWFAQSSEELLFCWLRHPSTLSKRRNDHADPSIRPRKSACANAQPKPRHPGVARPRL